jgi:hypothetical protein
MGSGMSKNQFDATSSAAGQADNGKRSTGLQLRAHICAFFSCHGRVTFYDPCEEGSRLPHREANTHEETSK